MTWATPIVAAIAAGIAVPSLIILYFLKLKRRPVEVSTTLLWKKAIEDLQANAPFQKLRRNILLLLQLLVLAAALVAAGQPRVEGTAPAGQKHVILIDRSASMSARDGTDGDGNPAARLDQAKREALDLIEALKEARLWTGEPADEAMVVAFDRAAEVRQPFTSDKALLRAAVESIETVDTASSLKAPLQLVAAHAPRQVLVEEQASGERTVHDRPAGRIGTLHIWSDGRLPDASEATFGAEDTVRYYPLGGAVAPNVGITGLRAGRDFNDPRSLSIFVGVQNCDRVPRAVDAELRIDGVRAAIKSMTVPASEESIAETAAGAAKGWSPGTGGVIFELDRPEGGIVTVALTNPAGGAPDLLAVDDTASLVVPPARRLSVAVVTPGSLAVLDALAALPLARLVQHTPESFTRLLAGDGPAEFDVVVLDRWTPPPGPNGEFLPPGRYLVLGALPGGDSGLSEPSPESARDDEIGVMVDWARDHPALRSLALDNVYMFRPRAIAVADGAPARVLGRSDRGPAILELASVQSKALVVAFDPAASTWWREVSWVVFVGQAVGYLGDDGGEGLGRMVRPGDVYADRLPPGATGAEVSTSAGSRAAIVPAPDGGFVYGPVVKAGTYRVSWKGPAGPGDATVGEGAARAFTSNLLDAFESDISAASTFETGSKTVTGQTESGERATRPRPLWAWLLLVALLVLMLEWYVYNRKVHV